MQKKTIINLIALALIFWSFNSCAGGKDPMYSLEKEAPVTFGKIYFQKWVAGVQEGGSGTNVFIEVNNYKEAVVLKNVYFRNKIEPLQSKPNLPDNFTGYFKDEMTPDVMMDSNPVKEAKNVPQEVFPFKLKDNEAVISYEHNGALKFVKIGPMEEKPLLAYPGVNPNGID